MDITEALAEADPHQNHSRINSPSLFFWGEELSKPNVKEFPGNPTVFVASTAIGVEVTTPEHMRNANRPLIQILKEICEEARVYANEIYSKYERMWFPCGSADVVLRWNTHRDIIQLFKKEADPPKRAGSRDWYTGWFGRLFKTSDGWWWIPKLDKNSQSMKYEEAICQFVRDKLIFCNIKVDVRTYID